MGIGNNPNTPFANARRMARRLGNAVLLKQRGYGHGPIRTPVSAPRRRWAPTWSTSPSLSAEPSAPRTANPPPRRSSFARNAATPSKNRIPDPIHARCDAQIVGRAALPADHPARLPARRLPSPTSLCEPASGEPPGIRVGLDSRFGDPPYTNDLAHDVCAGPRGFFGSLVLKCDGAWATDQPSLASYPLRPKRLFRQVGYFELRLPLSRDRPTGHIAARPLPFL